MIRLSGRARLLGDDINTDYIIASSRKRETLDESVLKQYLLETVDPMFAASVRDGDILVAGRNFGCGSAMEIAVTVLLAAGIRAVVATTFARTFFRNAMNNGLVPVECSDARIGEGEALTITMGEGIANVINGSTGERFGAVPLANATLAIVSAGGLVPHVRARGTSTAT